MYRRNSSNAARWQSCALNIAQANFPCLAVWHLQHIIAFCALTAYHILTGTPQGTKNCIFLTALSKLYYFTVYITDVEFVLLFSKPLVSNIAT